MDQRMRRTNGSGITRRRFLRGAVGLAASSPLLAALAQLGCGQQAPAVPAKSSAPAPSVPAPSPSMGLPSASAAPVDAAQAAYKKAMEGWDQIEAAAKKEGRVVVASTAAAAFWDAMRKGFKARYPEIEVEFVGARGPEQRERARTEIRTGQRLIDLSISSPMSHNDMLGDGSLEAWKAPAALDPANKWVMHPYDPKYFNGEGAMAGFTQDTNCFLINTKLLSPADEPKTWRDLTNPKLKGQMVGQPAATSGGLAWYYDIARQYGKDYIDKMKAQDYKISDKLDEMARSVGLGEYAVAFPMNSSIAVPYLLQGMPLKLVHPTDGGMSASWTLAIIKSPPHANAVRVFVNFLLTRDGQKTLSDGSRVPNMRGVPVPHPSMDLEGVNVIFHTAEQWVDMNSKAKEPKQLYDLD